MKQIWKRAFAYLLVAVLVVTLFHGATPARAMMGTESTAPVTEGAEPAEVTLLQDEGSEGAVFYVADGEDLAQVLETVEDGVPTQVILRADNTLTRSVEIREGQDIELDLNGHTLTVVSQGSAVSGEEQEYFDAILVHGSLTVKGNGRMVSESDETTILSVEGIFASADVQDTEMSVSGYNCVCASASDDAYLSMTGVTLYGRGERVCYGAAAFDGAKLSIENSSVETSAPAMVFFGQTVTETEDEPTSREADVRLYNTTVRGIGLGILASNTDLTLDDGTVIEALASPNAEEGEVTTAVHANEGRVGLYGKSVVHTDGGKLPGIGLDLYNCNAAVREASQITVNAETATGIRQTGAGDVDLQDAFLQVDGSEAYGVRFQTGYDDSDAYCALYMTDTVEIAVNGAKRAVGVDLNTVGLILTDSVTIRATGQDATGLVVNGGTLIANSTQARIEAGTEESQRAVALQVYAHVDPDFPTAPTALDWRHGDASAVAANPDNAFALLVELPEDEPSGNLYAEIRPDSGTFMGRVCAMWNGEERADSGAIAITGGRFSVAPKRAYLPAPYVVQESVNPSDGALYEVKSQVESILISNGIKTEYATLREAWDAANSGDTIRLYSSVKVGQDEPLTLPAGKTLTLEMNGLTISGDGMPRENGSVLRVEGNLTIEAAGQESGAVPGEFLHDGGTITSGNSTNTAGGIVVCGTAEQDAFLTMNGGTVTLNTGRVGGIEARYATVLLNGTNVSQNTGEDAGGIEAIASNILLGRDAPAATIEENRAVGVMGTGGILLRALDDNSRSSSLIAEYGMVSMNHGSFTGGIASYDSAVNLSGSYITENVGGQVGGLYLYNSSVNIGALDTYTAIYYNQGGLYGGAQVIRGYPDDASELTLYGTTLINSNFGGVTIDPETLEVTDVEGVELNLALYARHGDGSIPVGVISPDTEEYGSMEVAVSIVRAVYEGDEVPENGVNVLTQKDTGARLYVLPGVVTTAGVPVIQTGENAPYLCIEDCYGDDYQLTRSKDGSYAIVATDTKPDDNPGEEPAPGTNHSQKGCYVATSVYGSYDCPEVWTLRRFRDEVLGSTWYGRLFIRVYYAVSPTAVKLFGDSAWFQDFFRTRLDKMVVDLQADGFDSTPYQDTDW